MSREVDRQLRWRRHFAIRNCRNLELYSVSGGITRCFLCAAAEHSWSVRSVERVEHRRPRSWPGYSPYFESCERDTLVQYCSVCGFRSCSTPETWLAVVGAVRNVDALRISMFPPAMAQRRS